ncbi:MAG: Holliday junction resolvase RuvX [Candidatus Cloacimonetes bacterium]|nr:Holliday junction resolvase RuvX [Candidatus Cloacimonadota bacterium]
MTQRIAALDYGEKRIGVALSDPLQIIAKPFAVWDNTGFEDTVAKLQELIRDYQLGEVIVGIPLSVDGEITAKTAETMRFLHALKKAVSIPVTGWDERYSTAEAHELLKDMGMSWMEARQKVDAMAASVILKSYLDRPSE